MSHMFKLSFKVAMAIATKPRACMLTVGFLAWMLEMFGCVYLEGTASRAAAYNDWVVGGDDG